MSAHDGNKGSNINPGQEPEYRSQRTIDQLEVNHAALQEPGETLCGKVYRNRSHQGTDQCFYPAHSRIWYPAVENEERQEDEKPRQSAG